METPVASSFANIDKIIDHRGIIRQPSDPWNYRTQPPLLWRMAMGEEGIAIASALSFNFLGFSGILFMLPTIAVPCCQFGWTQMRSDRPYSAQTVQDVNRLIVQVRPKVLYVVTATLSRLARWGIPRIITLAHIWGPKLVLIAVFLAGSKMARLPTPSQKQWQSLGWRILQPFRLLSFGLRTLCSFSRLWPSSFRKTPLEKWKYSPINNSDSIRLLRLHRWMPFLGLSGTIIHVVELKDAPKYDAISYSWGTTKTKRSMMVNGLPFEISTSTYDALRSVSSLWRPRLLWIDYVCINQSDYDEKAKQVKIMKDIYHRSERVIVYLGNDPHAPLVHFLLHEMMGLVLNQRFSARQIFDRFETKALTLQWMAFIRFLNLPWFSRIWIVQEIAVAAKIRVIYGGVTYDWDSLVALTDVLMEPEMTGLIQLTEQGRQAVRHMHHLQVLDRLRTETSLIRTYKTLNESRTLLRAFGLLIDDPKRVDNLDKCTSSASLSHLLQSCKNFEATDARDKVFALLGLVSEDPYPNPPIADYSPAVRAEDVFIDTARYILGTKKPLQILSYAGISTNDRLEYLPSWVPDWTHVPLGLPLAGDWESDAAYKASGDTKSTINIALVPQTLQLATVYVDEIAFTSSIFSRIRDDNFVQDSAHNLFHAEELTSMYTWHQETRKLILDHVQDPYPFAFRKCKPGEALKCQSRTEAFWRTLVGDNTTTQRPAPPVLGTDYAAWVKLMDEMQPFIAEIGHTQTLPSDDAFWARQREDSVWGVALARCIAERRVCVTKSGFLGCVPAGSAVGDTIVVVLGASAPFVVREALVVGALNCGEEQVVDEAMYNLVGECYIHGRMDGEALTSEARTEMMTFA